MTEDNSGLFNDSRRSFMKKGALATTAVALGAGATSGTAAAQEDGQVLVYGDDYRPGVDFEVISALNTSTKEDLIADSGSEDDIFDDPDDWDAYIISYDLGVDAPEWGFLLTEEVSLSAGDTDTMGDDGEFRDSQLDLIEATPGETGNGGDDEEDAPEEDAPEEDAPEEDAPEEDAPEEDGNGGGGGGGGGD